MANLALAREALQKLLALPNACKEAKYYAKIAISHMPPPLDPNIQYPCNPDMTLGGPFPEEGT